MRTVALPTPGVAAGAYPERKDPTRRGRHSRAQRLWAAASTRLDQRRQQWFLDQVHAQDAGLSGLTEPAFRARLAQVRAHLGASGLGGEPVAEAFALVREATRRHLGLAHFDTQLIAGRIMLDNRLAEMATGEGKTLAAALTAATVALAGMPVHVVTANEYLVTRDSTLLGPVYRALGLSVGAVTRDMNQDQRRSSYANDITYCTAKELVFDYLRDRLTRRSIAGDLQERVRQLDTGKSARQQLLLRGLWMALIDEADSILIDEARTPFILSQPRVNAQQQRWFREALDIALRLTPRIDFRIEHALQTAELTDAGREALAVLAQQAGGLWQDRRVRDEIVSQALAAHHLYHRDRQYVVRDDKVVMVDQTTGRLAPGRQWSRGLHQLLEVKEACTPTGEMETIAQITYQRFFPRYLRLGGMSGTLREAAGELHSVYGLSVATVPLRKPSRRTYLPIRVYGNADDKWEAVVTRVSELAGSRRPVLVGTDSVADSEHLSRRMTALNMRHDVLNARDDSEEARIVAHAGELGHVTVTTNMAGRGTDIVLEQGVESLGGLHVVCCQHNASGRIDRQLQGRCARQGDPGSVETILSLEDPLISRYWPAWVRTALRKATRRGRPMSTWLGKLIAVVPQTLEELRQRRERRALLEHDNNTESRLSFAGRGE